MSDDAARRRELASMLRGYQRGLILYAVVVSGALDRDTLPSAQELAHDAGTTLAFATLLLESAQALGLATQQDSSRQVTQLGRCTRRDAPRAMRAQIEALPIYMPAWMSLLTPSAWPPALPFVAAHGQDFFEYLSQRPSAWQTVISIADLDTKDLLDDPCFHLDVRGERVLDVGGGSGAFAKAMMARFGALSATLYDLRQPTSSNGLDTLSGDAREVIPSDFDVYIFKDVLHDMPDGDVTCVLENLRGALAHSNRALILERIRLDEPANWDQVRGRIESFVNFGVSLRSRQDYIRLASPFGLEVDLHETFQRSNHSLLSITRSKGDRT